MSDSADTGGLGTSLDPRPFSDVSAPLRKCWDLGYHDGFAGLEARLGEAALSSFVVADHQQAIDEATLDQAIKRADLGIVSRQSEQNAQKLADLTGMALPLYGTTKIGWSARLMPTFYLLCAGLAFIAEYFISAQTVAESIGGDFLSEADLVALWDSAIWALTAMLCLLGVSIKLFIDSLHHQRLFRLVEQGVTAVALVLSVMSIYGVGALRDAIGNADAAAIRDWTGATFMWVTWALPAFAAACLVVALQQFRAFTLHNSVIDGIVETNEARNAAERQKSALEHELKALEERLIYLSDKGAALSEFADNALGTYQHGYAVGAARRADLDAALPLYHRLRRGLGLRLPHFIGGPLA